MSNNLAFITGSRSEFGALSKLISTINDTTNINFKIIVHGAHNNKTFGNTIDEIKQKFEDKIVTVKTFSESDNNKDTFLKTVSSIFDLLKNNFTHVYLVGDRIETYAAAIAAHLLKIPIFHYGGGNLSKGSDDNIYRYNISNLAKVHFTTSLPAYNRLRTIPTIDKECVYFVGSSAVDSIIAFLKEPLNINDFYPSFFDNKVVLMTFHPATKSNEDTSVIMDYLISLLIEQDYNILITFPNHDEGYKKIVEIINKWKDHSNVIIDKHLGQKKYYTAINNSEFVIGNTSSGFVEVPYFSKIFFNIGERQEGRDKDPFVINIPANKNIIKEVVLNNIREKNSIKIKNINLYGDGNSVSKIIKIIKKEIS